MLRVSTSGAPFVEKRRAINQKYGITPCPAQRLKVAAGVDVPQFGGGGAASGSPRVARAARRRRRCPAAGEGGQQNNPGRTAQGCPVCRRVRPTAGSCPARHRSPAPPASGGSGRAGPRQKHTSLQVGLLRQQRGQAKAHRIAAAWLGMVQHGEAPLPCRGPRPRPSGSRQCARQTPARRPAPAHGRPAAGRSARPSACCRRTAAPAPRP